MNILGEAWYYSDTQHLTEGLLQNFITQCFHRSWFGAKKSIIQISWFWRWEVKIPPWEMMYFTAFSFGYTATFFQTWIRATCLTSHEVAEHFVCHGELSKKQPRDKRFRKLVIFVCWLAPNYILLLLTFGKLTRCQQWHWRMRSSHKNVIPNGKINGERQYIL